MSDAMVTRLDRHAPVALGVLRMVFAFLYTAAGTSKLFAWPVAAFAAPSVAGFPVWWAGVIETAAGVLLLVGLFTRQAAFLASGEMAAAYFMAHQPLALWPIDPAQDYGEIPIMYCFAFLLLVFAGPGAFALDHRRLRRAWPSM